MRTVALFILSALALAAGAMAASPSTAPTRVDDAAALRRLRGNSGVTLQWIGFDTPARGHLVVRDVNGRVHLSGTHRQARGDGRLSIDGDVVAIGARHFTFRGRIAIIDSPDPGRRCIRDGLFDFRVTGQRRYWRLQQMEQCDGLTDYVDIYY